MGEHRPQFQASMSSSPKFVCSVPARLANSTYEILLDSGSTISSISSEIAETLGLPISAAAPIRVLFGDNKEVYYSQHRVYCTFSLAHTTFHHPFYVLPRQLFPLTLGTDWFIQSKAQLHFDSCTLVIPNVPPISIFTTEKQLSDQVNTQVNFESTTTTQSAIQQLLQSFPQLFQKSAHPS